MRFRRITEQDMEGHGNVGKPDVPAVSAAEMQRILDELPREVIAPAFNQLAGELESDTAAACLGAELPAGLPEETPHTVKGVLQALLNALNHHCEERKNPHGVTAGQVGAYTRGETDQAIANAVLQTGAADMTKAEYGGSKTGTVKDSDRLGGLPAKAYAPAAAAQVFSCTFDYRSWKKEGSRWIQTVPCEGMRAAYECEPPYWKKSGQSSRDMDTQLAMDQLCEGYLEPQDGAVKATLYLEPKMTSITVYMRRTA